MKCGLLNQMLWSAISSENILYRPHIEDFHFYLFIFCLWRFSVFQVILKKGLETSSGHGFKKISMFYLFPKIFFMFVYFFNIFFYFFG